MASRRCRVRSVVSVRIGRVLRACTTASGRCFSSRISPPRSLAGVAFTVTMVGTALAADEIWLGTLAGFVTFAVHTVFLRS
jgi:hypothetical protein